MSNASNWYTLMLDAANSSPSLCTKESSSEEIYKKKLQQTQKQTIKLSIGPNQLNQGVTIPTR
jgi:hypothetical protein